MTIVLVIIILLGGGASVAAEKAVPGDALYPVKVSVNEEVRSALSFSAEAKARFEARRAERRLEEAEKLSLEGRLNAETRAEIASRFEEHAEAFEEHAAKVEGEQRAEAVAEARAFFAAMLQARESALIELTAKEEGSAKEEAQNLVQSIRAVLEASGKGEARMNADTEMKMKGEMGTSSNAQGETKAEAGAQMRVETGAGGAGVKTEGTIRGEVNL